MTKHVQYDIVADGDGWAIEVEGKRLHRYDTLPEAEAAAFDMARTDRDRGIRAEVNVPPSSATQP
jgi:hypothetical protein